MMKCSASTIRYTHYFYCLYSQLLVIRQQDADVFDLSEVGHLARITRQKRATPGDLARGRPDYPAFPGQVHAEKSNQRRS